MTIDALLALPECNGRIGATGMCLGGHLAFRCAFDRRVAASVCYFATDIHSRSLGKGKEDDSLLRCGEIQGEVVMIFGKSEFCCLPFSHLADWGVRCADVCVCSPEDTHVPPAGRDLIRQALHEKGVVFSWYEVAWAQRLYFLVYSCVC